MTGVITHVRQGAQVHEDSSHVTIPSVDSVLHEFTLITPSLITDQTVVGLSLTLCSLEVISKGRGLVGGGVV